MTDFGAPMRAAFSLPEGIRYLNHGAFGLVPREVQAAQRRWQDAMESSPVEYFMRQAPGGMVRSRHAAAHLLGCDADSLVLVENATSAVAAVLQSMDFDPGDEVVTTNHAYPAVMRALEYRVARAGARLVVASVPFPLEGPNEVIDAVSRALGPRTRLLLVDGISSATGTCFPVEACVALAREHGVPIMVDGAHMPGHVPLQLSELEPDFWCGNLHKWAWAPRGCAVLYAAPRWRESMHPPVISHGLGEGWQEEFDWTGTRDSTAWMCVPEAMAFGEQLGWERIQAHNRALCLRAANLLAERWGCAPAVPESMRANLATLPVPGPGTPERAVALRDQLYDQHRLELPFFAFEGRMWLRISAQIYNELDEYEFLAKVLPEIWQRV